MEAPTGITNTIQNAQDQIANTASGILTNAGNTLNEFTEKASVAPAAIFGQDAPTSDFLTTNGIIAKFVFIFFVTLVFLILFQVGLRLVTYLYNPPRNVILLDKLVSGTANIRMKQNTATSANTPIYRSNNEESGMEFTWGVWVYVDNQPQATGDAEFQHIFSKGDPVRGANGNATTMDGVLTPNNAPGLYVKAKGGESKLRVYMDDATVNQSYVEMNNVPLRKWIHVAIRLKNMELDVYVNGAIAARKKMAATPKQNYGDILIGATQFNGSISGLAYYDSAIDILQITNIVEKGPNMNMDSAAESKAIDYLSRLWYTDKW